MHSPTLSSLSRLFAGFTLTSLLVVSTSLTSFAQVPGKRRVTNKVLKKVARTHPKLNLHSAPSKKSKAAIAAANAVIVAAGAKAAWDTFYETNDREAFHKALGENRVSNSTLLDRLNAHIQSNFYLDEYIANVSLTEKRHNSFIPLPLEEVYLTKSGSFLIGNLYYEAPDSSPSVEPIITVMKPFNARIGERVVNNPDYAEYVEQKLKESKLAMSKRSREQILADTRKTLSPQQSARMSDAEVLSLAVSLTGGQNEFETSLRENGLKIGLSDEDRRKILSLGHSSRETIPPAKIVAYGSYPKPGLIRAVFEDPTLKSLSALRIHLYGHSTDRYGEDHLLYCRSVVVERAEIARIKNWQKIHLEDFIHYEQLN